VSSRSRHPETLSPGTAGRLDAVCDRFEADWLAGGRPRLEGFLPQVEVPERPPLLRELLALDLDYRARLGERPAAEEYVQRLPEYAALVNDCFAAFSAIVPGEPATLTAPTVEKPPGPDPAAADEAPGRRAGRYEVEGEIARGGMGAVLRARDTDLGRTLALKVLLEGRRGQPEVERRFREEAQITGQLQHPGIPPVHEVGTLPDGRPFFAMKLVKGRTLADLLQERATPADDLPRFLGIFEQVCQTLAYAHSRGVVHRDLKPSNVMVGAFGEVQVMDWGLAKVLGTREGTSSRGMEGSTIATVRTAGEGMSSQEGAVLGTPAYMAPEQARGEVELLDERCDVFGLGAILCVILTGRPPYRGATSGEVHARAARGDLADTLTRLAACGAEEALVQLARRCLAPERDGRPGDAGEVERALGAYLAGVQQRLREAERQRAAAEARAVEERKRRRLAVALAGAVVVLLSSAGAGVWWYQRVEAQRAERRARTGRQARQALDEVEGLAKKAREFSGSPDAWEQALGRALSAARQAQGVLEAWEADEPLCEEATRLRRALEEDERERQLVAELDDILLRSSDLQGSSLAPAGFLERYREAFRQYGIDVLSPSVHPEEIVRRLQSRPQRERFFAALADWGRWADRHVAQWPSRAPMLAALMDLPQAVWDRERLESVARKADPDPGSLKGLWRKACQDKDWAAIRALVREAEGQPLAPAVFLDLFGDLRQVSAGSQEAVRLLRAGLQRHPRDFWLNFALAFTLYHLKPPRLDEAGVHLAVARDLRSQSAVVRSNLGAALSDQGRAVEAAAACRQAIGLDPSYARAHSNLGDAYRADGKFDDAVAACRQAIELDPTLAPAYHGLGQALQARGQPDQALAAYREAIRRDPKYLKALHSLGDALHGLRRFDEAIVAFRLAIEIEPTLAPAYCNLGNSLYEKGELEGAAAACRKAIDLDPTLAPAHHGLGRALQARGQLGEALATYRKAVDLDPKYVKALNDLGDALQARGQVDEAIVAYRLAISIELGPAWAPTHYKLGVALQDKGQLDGAIAAFRQTVQVEPTNAKAYANLAALCEQKGRLDEAIDAFRQTVRLEADSAPAYFKLGNSLRAKGQLDGAIAAYCEAIKRQPDHADSYGNLGLSLRDQGRFPEALAALKRGHELGPSALQGPFSSAQWVQQVERLLDLDGRLPAILAGRAPPSTPAEQIELASMCIYKQRLVAAVCFYSDAFAAEPELTDDLPAGHRYRAACAAARAAAGQGADTDGLTGEEVALLHAQALHWLRADLATWARLLDDGRPEDRPAVQQALRRWQQDPDLPGARDPAELERLPEAERQALLHELEPLPEAEAQAWRQLWADVAVLLRQAGPK
jgi:tetratricopeptide (TPR) repeat protein